MKIKQKSFLEMPKRIQVLPPQKEQRGCIITPHFITDNPNLKEERETAWRTQLAFVEANLKGLERVICPEKVCPASNRNIGLKKFYASDYDYAIIMDDDLILRGQLPVGLPQGIDAYSGHAWSIPPKDQRALIKEDKVVFYKGPIIEEIDFCVIINTKKYYGLELYQNPTFLAKKNEGREDIAFRFNWRKKGLNWYTCLNSQIKCFCDTASLQWEKPDTSIKDREAYAKNTQITADKLRVSHTIRDGKRFHYWEKALPSMKENMKVLENIKMIRLKEIKN